MADARRGVLVPMPVSDDDVRWMLAVGYAYRDKDGTLALTATGIGWTRDWLRRQRESAA